MRKVSIVDRCVKAWKTRTDDLWEQQEAELKRLQKENQQLAEAAHDWETLTQKTYLHLIRGEYESLEALDEAEGDERLRIEGERQAFRRGQVAMEITGRSLGIYMHRPNN